VTVELAQLAVWSWAAARIWAVLRAQALWRVAIGPLWWLVALVPSLALAPLAAGPAPAYVGFSSFAGLLVVELLLGTSIGLVATLPGYALLGVGETAGTLLGARAVGSRGVAWFCVVFVLAISLMLGLHRPLLGSILATFDTWPVGDPVAWSWVVRDELADTIVAAAHGMTVLALALATPVLLAIVVVDVAVRLFGRGPAPAGPAADSLVPWLRVALALVALGASWSAYTGAWTRAVG
jgi:flagellar biosynthesis protein FliR